jgi:hypothetical protein
MMRRSSASRTRGLESGLNFIIAEATKGNSPNGDHIARSIRSESRRERNRGALRRRYYLVGVEPAVDPLPMLDVRSELRIAQSKVSDADWDLLTAIGIGNDYSEIKKRSGSSTAATRVRVMRLRRQVVASKAA